MVYVKNICQEKYRLQRTKKHRKISEKIDNNFDKNIIRIIHQFFHRNKL